MKFLYTLCLLFLVACGENNPTSSKESSAISSSQTIQPLSSIEGFSSSYTPTSSGFVSSSSEAAIKKEWGAIYQSSIGLDSTQWGNMANLNDGTIYKKQALLDNADLVFHMILFFDEEDNQVKFGTRSSAFQVSYWGNLLYTMYNDSYVIAPMNDTLSFDSLDAKELDVANAVDASAEMKPLASVFDGKMYLILFPMFSEQIEFRIVRFRNYQKDGLNSSAAFDLYVPSQNAIDLFNSNLQMMN